MIRILDFVSPRTGLARMLSVVGCRRLIIYLMIHFKPLSLNEIGEADIYLFGRGRGLFVVFLTEKEISADRGDSPVGRAV